MKKILVPFLLAAMLLGCGESGPQKALNQTAAALGSHNPQAFLAQLDMDAYANNYIGSLAGSAEVPSSLNAIGQVFGIDNLDKFIGNLVGMKARLANQFTEGVASGELAAQCRTTASAGCPWIPQSLRDAQIVEISPTAAIAKVTTPQSLVSWLALRKIGDKWLIVGQAVMENQARSMAMANLGSQTPGQGKQL